MYQCRQLRAASSTSALELAQPKSIYGPIIRGILWGILQSVPFSPTSTGVDTCRQRRTSRLYLYTACSEDRFLIRTTAQGPLSACGNQQAAGQVVGESYIVWPLIIQYGAHLASDFLFVSWILSSTFVITLTEPPTPSNYGATNGSLVLCESPRLPSSTRRDTQF